MSGSKLSDQQLYFAGVFEDFGHIFLTCSKKIIKIWKVGKIFGCVTFYKLFAGNFSKNSNLYDSCSSLPVFLSRTNLKLHNISVTLKMIKVGIKKLDLSKAFCPDCITVVVLTNCELEFSSILAELFHKFLKQSYPQIKANRSLTKMKPCKLIFN